VTSLTLAALVTPVGSSWAQQGDSLPPGEISSTTHTVPGTDVDRFPVDDALDLLRLMPGVTSGLRGRITLRGSRPGDQALWIDGVPFRSMDTGEGELSLAPNTVLDAAMSTGVLAADVGDHAGGVVALRPRVGGGPWRTALSYESDAIQGHAMATGLRRLEAAGAGTAFGLVRLFAGAAAVARQGAELGAGMEDVPVFARAGIDSVVGTPLGTPGDSLFVTLPRLVQYGGECRPATNDAFECQGRRRPHGWTSGLRWVARAALPYARGASLSLSAIGSERQEADWRYLLNPDGQPGARSTASALTAHWRQPLPDNALGDLTVHVTASLQRERSAAGPIADADLMRDPASLALPFDPLSFVTGFSRFAPVAPDSHLTRGADQGWLLSRLDTDEAWDAAVENLRYDRGTIVPYPRQDDLQLRSRSRVNAYGVDAAFVTGGVDFGTRLADERRTYGRIALVWRQSAGQHTRVTVERSSARVGRWEMGLTSRAAGYGYTGDPVKMAFSIAHQARFDPLSLHVGVRWDRFDAGTMFPLTPGRVHTHPAFDPSANVASMTCPRADAADCDTTTYVWIRSQAHTAFSPRVAVAAPLGARTVVRVGFGVHAQAPPLSLVAAGGNNDVTVATGRGLFGGDVGLSRTLLYEAAARHALRDDFTVHLAVYQKDLRDQLAYRSRSVHDPVLDSLVPVAVLTNADFGTVRGVEIGLDKRWGESARIRASYAFQHARSTASDATEFLFGLTHLTGSVPLDVPVRTRDDRAHALGATAFWQAPAGFRQGTLVGSLLGGVGAYATVEVRSGLPYTSLANDSGDTRSDWYRLADGAARGALRDATTPWQKLLDLRVSKTVRVGPTALEFYADVRNVFGWSNVEAVFAESGATSHAGLRERLVGGQLERLEREARWAGLWVTQSKDASDGSGRYTLEAIDLRTITVGCPSWPASGGGPTACVMLERTERRFGDGDALFDVEEQAAAVNAWYDFEYAAARLHGRGRSLRVGLRLGF
jgi:hypothetical protein